MYGGVFALLVAGMIRLARRGLTDTVLLLLFKRTLAVVVVVSADGG